MTETRDPGMPRSSFPARRLEGATWRCGTPDPPRSPLEFNIDPILPWDRRDFTYAFGAMPGATNSSSPPQMLSPQAAQAAVRRALRTWEQAGVELRFREVSVDQDPDIVIEWLTAIHADQDATPAPAAHAAFPPGTPRNTDDVYPDPPLPIHFNDTDMEWTSASTESIALHEIGHCLGLRHADENTAFPCAGPFDPTPPSGPDPLPSCPIMLENGPAGQTDLQPDDLDGIRALFEVYPGDRRVRFNAVWADGSLERKARWGRTREDLQAEIRAQQAGGFKPGSINAYVRADGNVVYNAILDQVSQRRTYVTERTRENFAAEHTEKTEQGFRPFSVSAFIHPDGTERFNGVWTDDDDASEMIFSAARDEFDRERTRLKQRGYRPMQISTHVLSDGQERWNGVFWKNPRESIVLLGATREQFDEAAEQNRADGFRVDDITTYLLPNGQGERWNGVWERNDTVSTGSGVGDARTSSGASQESAWARATRGYSTPTCSHPH